MILLVVRLIGMIAPHQKQHWAQAMQSEIVNMHDQCEALRYSLGCLVAAIRFRFAVDNLSYDDGSKVMNEANTAIIIQMLAGIGAVAVGITYLAVAKAPSNMILVNVGAAAIGLVLFVGLQFTTRQTPRMATCFAVVIAIVLLGTALFGVSLNGASRWIKAGPMFVQTSLLFLPFSVTLFARVQNSWTLLAILAIAIAMAVQPDRAMSGALFASLTGLTFVRKTRANIAVLSFSGVAFLATMLQADRLPAVPYVDHILWSSFAVHPVMGAAMWLGCALLFMPVLRLRSLRMAPERMAFSACWAAMVSAAALGAYPTPIVGYGASAIIGYFLCLIGFRRSANAYDRGQKPQSGRIRAVERDTSELQLIG